MPLNEIYTALAESITGEPPDQKIDLYAAASNKPALAPLKEVLSLFGIQDSYTISNVKLTQNVSAITLTGGGTFGIPGAALPDLSNVTARLVATSPDNQDHFELSLAVTDAAWTFSKTFAVLPDTQMVVGQAVNYKPSFLIDLPLGKPTFVARSIAGSLLELSGELGPAGALEKYADLFAPWPLRLEGTLEMPANPAKAPTLNLTALSPSLVFQIGRVSLREVGLQFTVVNDLDEETYGRSSFSVLDLVATLYLGETDPIKGTVSTPLLASSSVWRLMVDFEDGAAPLTKGLARIAGLFGVPEDVLMVPTGFDDFTGFYISEIEIAIVPPTSSEIIPSIEHIAVTLGSKKEWNPPIPFVRVRDVGTRWLLGWTTTGGQTTQYLSGCVYGGVVIGGTQAPPDGGPVLRDQGPPPEALVTGDAFTIDIAALIPQFIVTGSLRTGDKISLVSAFRYFFGNPGPPAKADLAVTAFSFQADPRGQTYEASATITTILSEDNDPADWAIPLGGNVSITLMSLSFFINVTQGQVTGGINGEFLLAGGAPVGDPQPRFLVGAEYTGSDSGDGWIFTGSLYPDTYVELVSLVSNFLGITPPSSLPTLSLESLSVQFATGSRAYSVAGTVVGRWTPELFGRELAISASASVDLNKPAGATEAEGSLVGRFAINKVAVTVGINLRVNEPTYLFKIEFGHLWLSATTGWRDQGTDRHQILTVQLGGITLGGLLEYLVNLAAPTVGFKLDPPWDILNRIELSRFLLTIDPKEGSVELVYTANADLIFMRIDTIGVRYRRVRGESAVELVLTGKMLDRAYTTDKPLAWNVISDPPPSVPGKGNSLLDLRYIGVGQRITFKGELPNTVRETLDKLINDMRPVKNPNVSPLNQPSGSSLRGAPDAGWLIGIDASFMETVDLGLVFNDPRIYGLSIGLRGERAGPLAGLRFEILYKKITDDIGMFRIELRLPDALRHIELGAVSITLGIMIVEIYTNGNFFIDLGFPYNRNFDRSFSLLYFPFIGRGGFYFGLLDGNTSRRVPAITNGTFSPVLELGLGLAVGVGKEVTAGPLSGGAYVQVEVIFQGVLGWFNPSSSGTPAAKYYWVQGIAAISGKVYGKIDFKIIKVSVTIEAYAQVSMTIEAYRPTLLRLNVGVKVKAEIEVIFFTISFSFQAQLDLSFTIGSVQPTPWILASGQGKTTQARLRGNVLPAVARDPARRTNALRTQHLIELQRAGAIRALPHPGLSLLETEAPYVLNWNPHTKVFTDSPRNIPLTMLPAFSLTGVPVNWDGTNPNNPNPQYRVAFLLFAPNGVQPRALDNTAARVADLSAHANTPGELSSDTLIEALLRWAISAITGTPGNDPAAIVTAGQLHTLKEQMDRAETSDDGFSINNLGIFFDANLWLQISGDPGGTPNLQGGTAVPIPPFLSWTSPQAGDRNFATDDPVGPLYEWGASKFLSQYFPLEAPVGPPPPDDPNRYESFATFVFRDWSLMVSKAAVQAAFDAMQNWVTQVTGPASLADVAGRFPTATVEYAIRAGDTIDSLASALGATPAELEYLNPNLPGELANSAVGAKIQITLGIVPEVVAIDNSTVALVPGVKLKLGTVAYQVAQADTLSSIATRFGLTGPAALFDGTALADDPRLLRAGAEFEAPQTVYEPPAGLSTLLTAAIFYVRYYGPTDIPYSDWYAQTVFGLNATGALAGFDYDQPIPPGTTIKVPPALNNTSPTGAINYTTLPGDTLTRIGAALSLEQNFGAVSGPDQQWPIFRHKVQPVAGGVQLPSATVAIQPGETVNLLAARTIVHYNDLTGLLGWIGGGQILSPLAVVGVPAVSATTGTDGGTLAELATHFGLTVEDLASRITNDNIFDGSQEQPLELTIAHLPAQRIDAVVENVLGGKEPAQISGMSSRYLLSGLSLPAPEDDGHGHKVAAGPLTPLYELTGLQFPGPVPDLTEPAEVALSVTVTVNAGTQWIQLMGSTTVGEGEDFESLVARAPRVRELNRVLVDQSRLRPGMVVYTDPTPSLVFIYTNEQLRHDYPATGLGILPFVGPMALPLAGQAPKTYGLDHRVELQSPIALPIPTTDTAPLTGSASLWPLPSALLANAQAGSLTPYDIVRTNNRPDAGAEADTIRNSTFATLLPFGIRRLEEVDHVYELQGADTANRQVLLQVWQYLNNPDTPPGTKAFLLLAPAPNADNPGGLSVLLADNAKTFLVKTNETTETAPGRALKRREGEAAALTSSQYYASFGDLSQFAVLLWEGSVVGGAGYFLGFTTTDGQELPASAFDERGNATLYLLVVAGEQQSVAAGGRRLLAFNNCALIAPGLDPSANALFAEAADESDLISQPLVPPGNVGFRLLLPIPEQPPGERSPEIQLQQLFSLITYEVPASPGSAFEMKPPGLPAGPQEDDGQLIPIYQRRRMERWRRVGRSVAAPPATAKFWRYEHVLPIAHFGPASVAPSVSGLPDAENDPYRGIGGQTLSSAVIQLGFADVLGNATAPPAQTEQLPPGAISAPVGYTDQILGVSNWPALTTSYALSSESTTVNLTVTVAPQAAAIAPSPNQQPRVAIEAASRQASKYEQAYFQLIQPNMTAWILSSLKQDASGQPAPLETDPTLMWRFTAASYAASRAAASVTPVTASGTIGAIVNDYGLSFDALAQVNADQPIIQIFGPQPLVVPAFVIFADGDTADGILKNAAPGWPKPSSGAALLALPENAGVLPLRPGVTLSIPDLSVVVPPGTPTPALEVLAGAHGTTASLLASDNSATEPLLRVGFVFEMDGLTVTVGITKVKKTDKLVATFDDVRQAFAEVGVNASVGDIGAANAATPDMLLEGKALFTKHYITKDDETLMNNKSGVSAQDLAAKNEVTPGMFDAGALVYMGNFSPDPVIRPDDPQTLREFADRYACPLALLLGANTGLELPPETTVVIPGTVSVPQGGAGIWIPYTIGDNDTLDGVAGKFAPFPGPGTAAENLATADLEMPGTIAGGKNVSVTVDGHIYSTPTQDGDSFLSVLDRLRSQSSAVTLADLVVSIGDKAGYLAARGLLICPPCALPAQPSVAGGAVTPAHVQQVYGVTAGAFAQANAGVLGLIAGDKRLHNEEGTVSVTTRSNDTFNSIISRFAVEDPQMGLTELMDANLETAFLKSGGLALLPPTSINLEVSLGETAGPFAAPMFPLTVALRIQRPEAVVDPEFRTGNQDGPTERADTVVPAPSSPQGKGRDVSLTLAEFARAFKAAFHDLRLATGMVAGTGADLWVVNFTDDGIATINVAPGVVLPGGERWPRFFALRPLYNDLVTRPRVSIRTLEQDGKLSEAVTLIDYQAVDVEVWARRFLADVDLFLTAPYATGVYSIDSARVSLDQVLDAKQRLSKAIANGIAAVLVLEDPNAQPGRQKAVDALQQQLAVTLSRAYDTAAIVQYDATVTSAWTEGAQLKPARLMGTAEPAPPEAEGGGPDSTGSPFTLTGAKTDLDKAHSFVNFLMRVPDLAHHGSVVVNLDYDFLDLEFNISSVEGVGGYQASDWLSFVPPLAGKDKPAVVQTTLGRATVPIPLRAYPALPVLLGQYARATYDSQTALPRSVSGAPPLAQTPLWTYALTYSHEHAEQDEVLVTARFNIPPKGMSDATEEADDVATALAKYIAVADALWAMLAGLANPSRGGDLQVLTNAAATFHTLVSGVAAAWEGRWPPRADKLAPSFEGSGLPPKKRGDKRLNAVPPPPQSYGFHVRLTYRTGGDGKVYFDSLHLASSQDKPGPIGLWPDASCRAPDGKQIHLIPGQPEQRKLTYKFPDNEPIPAEQWPELTLEWGDLNVAAIENASASLAVRRNQKLLGDEGPDTAADFLYQTPAIDAVDTVTPLNSWPRRIDITGPGTGVADALRVAFDSLFGATIGLPITMGILYGYELVPPSEGDDEGLVTYLPVGLYPDQVLGPNTPVEIENALTHWRDMNLPVSQGGEWAFSLTLYSQLDADARRPLLVLDRLVYRISA